MTKDEGAKRSHPNRLRKNTLKEKDQKFAVNLRAIEALMKKEVPHQKGNQKFLRSEVDLEARSSPSSTSTGDLR